MNITAAMVWYDEPPDQLAAAVTSAGSLADRIVALDGGYRRFPGAQPHSPPEQSAAIREAADAAGMDALVLTPDRLWAGGVEKRNYLFAAACVGADWLLILDADWIVHANGPAIREELAALRGEVTAEGLLITPVNPDRSMRESAAGVWHRDMTLQPQWYPFLFRALPGMQVEQFHYWYSGLVNDRRGWKRIWLLANDPSNRYPTGGRHRLSASTLLEVEHRCLFRDREHILANRAFCNDREMVVAMTGQEDDVPGLPPPVFDYERIPQ